MKVAQMMMNRVRLTVIVTVINYYFSYLCSVSNDIHFLHTIVNLHITTLNYRPKCT